MTDLESVRSAMEDALRRHCSASTDDPEGLTLVTLTAVLAVHGVVIGVLRRGRA